MKFLIFGFLFFSLKVFAGGAQPFMDSSWECKMGEGRSRSNYTCAKELKGKRAVVKAEFKPAISDNLDSAFKILSTPLKDITIRHTKRLKIADKEWVESIQQQKNVPVPTMILVTVKKNTTFQFIVISDESNFEAIKNDVQSVVARSL